MTTVIKSLYFCYGHRLQHHHGACRNLHGHGARVDIEISGQLDAGGMVFDFCVIKDRLMPWIDRHLDHRMLLEKSDPLAEKLQASGEPIVLLAHPPTAEVLARLIYDQARELAIPVSAVHFWETPTSVAIYRGQS